MKSVEQHVREHREHQKELAENGPAERWRKPIIPVAVEETTEKVVHDGHHWRPDLNATFTDEDVERFRVGRACIVCWEPQEQAFPDHCALCRFPMRAEQPARFADEFQGEKWVGPSTSLSDEYERMLENGQRKRHVPGSQILIPGRDF